MEGTLAPTKKGDMDTTQTTSLYDQNEYYREDKWGSRLSPSLNGLLRILDWSKARKIAKLMGNKRGPILDVGAGDGKYLKFMRDRGFEPYGTTAARSSQVAAKRCYGIDLVFGKSLDPVLSEKKYQLITYWHVFEHLEDTESHASRWQELLADEGLLMIEVPNIESLGAKLCYGSWLGSDPIHHINHKTRKEIEEVLQKHQFKIESTEFFSLKFSYAFLWSALLGFLFGKNYHYDAIFDFLRDIKKSFQTSFLFSLNSLLSLVYLAPVILPLLLVETVLKRGEVVRIYARKN